MAYEKQNFVDGQTLKAEHLNHMEDGIAEALGTSVELDTTLTQSGKAADAKAVGEALAKISGGAVMTSVEPAEDDIPKVFFGGALQQTKDEAVVPFRYISKTQDISGYAEIKAQGNSSMSYPKKNQTAKLFKDAECTEKLKVDFKGWGKQNKHVYKANWIDITHARNVVSARLWADVVKSRINYAELPELLRTSPNQGAVDGFPIKVYANGVYQGRYTLNIPKDAWMANMDDDLDNHCILCGEGYVSGCFRQASVSQWTDEVHDTMPTAIRTRWIEIINFVMNSTDADFKANLGNYFDVDSLLDYYLFGLASCGLDAFGKNQLYMTYDGQKWFASMYDMDSTWGLYWNGGKLVPASYGRNEYEDYVHTDGNLLYNRLEALFHEELQARWAELRSDALSIENIINRFERFTDITPSKLVEEDYASSTADGKFTGIPSKTTSTIQQIRSYALARQAWCDTYIASLTPVDEVPCTGITLSASSLAFTTDGTQTLTATVAPDSCTDEMVWISDNPSVASITVDGTVCTVMAVANGTAVISVTCGEYSATCSVTVSGIDSGSNGAGFELAPEDVMYSLAAETTFDGISDYIDTGILLFDTAKDFTVLCHADFAQQILSKAGCAMHCIDEDAAKWPGLSIETNTNGYQLGGMVRNSGGWGQFANNLPNTMNKIAIRATQGIVDAVIYCNDGEIVQCELTSDIKYPVATQTMALGCRVLADGSRDRFWNGTIYDFTVANRALTYTEIVSYLKGVKPPENVPCTGITLSASSLTFTAAETRTLTATVIPIDCTDAVTWETSNANIATVSDGVVTVKSNGSCIITAKCGEQSATCDVTVSGFVTDHAGLYPFKTGTKTYSKTGVTVSISNGNHVKVTCPGSGSFGSQLFTIVNDVTGITSEDSLSQAENYTDYKNGLTEPLFVLAPGATITRKIRNLATSNLNTNTQMVQSMFAGTNKGETKFEAGNVPLNTAGSDWEGSFTNTGSSDMPIWAFCLWIGSGLAANLTVEFDVEVYVDDVRYV